MKCEMSSSGSENWRTQFKKLFSDSISVIENVLFQMQMFFKMKDFV